MIKQCVGFFVDELLWLMTWGWYQITLGLVFNWFMFVVAGRMRLIPALSLTMGSYSFAIITYVGFVAYLLITFFQWKFIAGGAPSVYNALQASLILGVILSVVQAMFFCIINRWRPFFITRFFILSLISNLLAAACGSLFIKINF